MTFVSAAITSNLRSRNPPAEPVVGGPTLPSLSTVSYNTKYGPNEEADFDELVDFTVSHGGEKAWMYQDFDAAVPKLLEYDMGTAHDLSTMSYNGISAQVCSYSTQRFRGMDWKSDGMSIFFVGYNDVKLSQIDVGTAYDMDWSASPTPDATFDLSNEYGTSDCLGLQMWQDGSAFLVTGDTEVVSRYTMSTPWDITTASLHSQGTLAESSNLFDCIMSDDGTRVWALSVSGEHVRQYTLSTPYDLSTESYDSISMALNGAATYSNPLSLFVPADGAKVLYVGWYGTTAATTLVEQYTWT